MRMSNSNSHSISNSNNISKHNCNCKPSVLPPLTNSWIIVIICLYIALNRTPNINCYLGGGGAVPNVNPKCQTRSRDLRPPAYQGRP